ncbi:MAG: hypothetical protein ACXADS_12375 [Candidatus Thorarchaeota archaeon]|jgi:hypothetical protein
MPPARKPKKAKSKAKQKAKPEKKPKKEHKEKSRYLFKITVVGPDDTLLERVLGVFNEQVVAVDGIRIGATKFELGDSDVRTLFMSPEHAALDILLSLTFKGAKGVIIVLREMDPQIETVYRNEIRNNLGEGIPTRVISLGAEMDEFKRTEIHSVLDDLLQEILQGAASNRSTSR